VSGANEEDLELARLCAAGDEDAWERFIRDYRPVLDRAADAMDPSGGAREIADSLYGELYGVRQRDGQRQSLFRYYQGRSSLATWLRAVLAQRFVDRRRVDRRLAPLADDDAVPASGSTRDAPDPHRFRYLALVRDALGRAIDRLVDRDRLRLGLYYVQDLTLAQIGRALKEHEATASRQLARTRRALRDEVERQLRDGAGLGPDEVARCLEIAADDPGAFDLDEALRAAAERKKPAPDRSI
jgi:RNA polymerase sigma-70 factor, ECF subfamily